MPPGVWGGGIIGLVEVSVGRGGLYMDVCFSVGVSCFLGGGVRDNERMPQDW